MKTRTDAFLGICRFENRKCLRLEKTISTSCSSLILISKASRNFVGGLGVDRGQFHWSVVATPGEAHLIGRAEVVSPSARVVSSYSCPTCCPDSGPFGGFYPYSYTLAIDGSIATSSSGDYYDCYWNNYPTSIWWSSLSIWDPAVATFMTGTEDLSGEDAGYTLALGTFDRTEWWTDNMDCYQYYYPAQSDAGVDVECTKPSSETTSGVGWDNLDPTLYKYEQTLSASSVSFVGRTVTEQDPGGGGPIRVISRIALGIRLTK
ncbi:MAG TPA: hypothetical protein VJT71_11075 [Pyrinomonadaceae bacterium]|nr:hypothetical protein [Pyrinomonadaceae bacterium]